MRYDTELARGVTEVGLQHLEEEEDSGKVGYDDDYLKIMQKYRS